MIEFRVWNENGDLIDECDTQAAAERAAEKARASCGCGTDGQEWSPGRGDFACGVMHPHGIHVQIIEDGQDVTANDYGQYR